VRNNNFRLAIIAILAFAALTLTGCPNTGPTTPGGNETAALVNGKAITMQEVDRAVKQQAQGQESKLSPLELAAARLQVLEGLIQQEVLFQKAEKEAKVPTEEEVTAAINKDKTESRLSVEKFQEQLTAAGLDEKSFREMIKRRLTIDNLVEKITGRIEPPKDAEIEAFYTGNPDLFIKKRGVRLAAIVIDPSNSGEGDTTTDENSANLKIKELLGKLQMPGSDFAALAREYSEDPSKFQGGDVGYFSEEQLKQSYPQLAQGFMSPEFSVGRITNVVPIDGKAYIFKLLERVEKDENMTLNSAGVREQVTKLLIDSRKQLLTQSYGVVAMSEAKIENYLARKVVDNPNELSGARPAPTGNTNTNTAAITDANSNTNANVNTNANANVKTDNKVVTNTTNKANANEPR
jgi:parvulin-like peptidyl-prolyl isomerase